MQMLAQLMQSSSSAQAGQSLPSDGDSSAATAPQGPPPGPPPGMGGSGQFATQTLSALMDVQQNQPTATNMASALVQQFDTNGDGSLSLGEIENALNGTGSTSDTSSTSSSTDSALAQAFAKLDTNSDGELSTTELQAAITAFQQAQAALWSASATTSGLTTSQTA